MAKSTRKIPTKPPVLQIILIGILILTFFFLIKNYFFDNKKTEKAVQHGWEEKIEPISSGSLAEESLNEDDSADAQGAMDQPMDEPSEPVSLCRQQVNMMLNFFEHLEKQEYVAAYELKISVQAHVELLVRKLLEKPPIISAESDDLFNVLKNTAHFYRVLGHKDLYFVKDVLTYENVNLEHLMAVFYEWAINGKECQDSAVNLTIPLEGAYEYASFFLNTLGGQSYLFRRDSHLRILTRYYCVLILDLAMKNSLNKYNIDELYVLDSVIDDLMGADTLENQKDYLARLAEIKENL